VKAHAAPVLSMPLQNACPQKLSKSCCCEDVILLVGVMVLIAIANSVAISDFVILTPCVVSILLLSNRLIIFAFTNTKTVFLTPPFAKSITLSILLE